MPAISILIKPVSSACNMNCNYCFYKDEARKRQTACYGNMTHETAEKIIKKAIDTAEYSCSFMFQGGEPTLAGITFFQDFIKLEKQYKKNNIKIYNSIQTNGYKINEEWAKFFADNNFLVGVSLDGPAEIHNLNRKSLSGQDTFKEIMHSIDNLKKYNVQFNILSVITNKSAKQIEKIYNFFKRNNFNYLQFIPCMDPLNEERGLEKYSLDNKNYGDFLIRIFNLWFRDLQNGKYISIRHLDNWIGRFLGRPAEACDQRGICSVQFVTESNGNVYPCDFYVLDDRLLGNITKNSFDEMFNSDNAVKFIKESMELSTECKNCPYYSLCGGGCRRQRDLNNNGLPGKYHYCEAYKRFFSTCLPNMEKAAMLIRRINSR